MSAKRVPAGYTGDMTLPERALGISSVQEYGMNSKWRNLFTKRQLVALTTFPELVGESDETAYPCAMP